MQETLVLDFSNKVLNPIHARRKLVPNAVWDLRSYGTWWAEIWKLIDDFADSAVRSAFVDKPPRNIEAFDLSWLDAHVYKVNGTHVDSKSMLAEQLRKRYTSLRAVHGTRTAHLDSFYRNGLVAMVPEQLQARAQQIFLSRRYPDVTEAGLQAAIASVDSRPSARRVFFEADEDMLIAKTGQYLLYGSEYMTSIAANIVGAQDYRQVLKRYGQPTVLVCDVPLDYIDEPTLREFAGKALEMVFLELLDGPKAVRERWQGAAFSIQRTLAPIHLVGHYHPDVTHDPFE